MQDIVIVLFFLFFYSQVVAWVIFDQGCAQADTGDDMVEWDNAVIYLWWANIMRPIINSNDDFKLKNGY